MTHWAASHIGRPWLPEFDCWGFVREVFTDRLGIDLPEVAHGVLVLTEAAHSTGLRVANSIGQVDDLVLMRSDGGKRHVGIMAAANGSIGVLHNDGHMTERGPVGCVGFSTLHELTLRGFSQFQFWRRP